MCNNKKTGDQSKGLKQHLIQKLLYCTGIMGDFHTYMKDQALLMQLLEWLLRGVSSVIMVNNPLSGALILTTLLVASPWLALLGSLGLLSATVMALLISEDHAEISQGKLGYNGMLVALLIGVVSNAGDWYWLLLLPACFAGATTTVVYSGLAAVLGKWDLPVDVFPFNTVLILYLACTGFENPYYPNHPIVPQQTTLSINSTLDIAQLMQGVVLGVGQIYTCDSVWSSIIILAAVLLYSPVQAVHALLGSSVGILAGLSVAVQPDELYTGMAGFNGALGCMTFGQFRIKLSWRTFVFSVMCAFLSSYTNIALNNLLANFGLPGSSWACALCSSLMLLVNERTLSTYSIANGPDSAPGDSLPTPCQSAETNMDSISV